MIERHREPPQKTSKLDRQLLLCGSMNKCDANLTIKHAARGGKGGKLGRREGLGLTHPSRRHLSQFPKKSGSRVTPILGLMRKQKGSSSGGDPPHPANCCPLPQGREQLTRRASHSPPSCFLPPSREVLWGRRLPARAHVCAGPQQPHGDASQRGIHDGAHGPGPAAGGR